MLTLQLLLWLGSCVHHTPRVTAEGPDRAYVVHEGDALERIALQFGVAGGYPELAAANGLSDPDWILVGQRLRIPATPSALEALPAWPTPRAARAPLKACTSQRARPPVVSPDPVCLQRACADVGDGRQVCACLGDGGGQFSLIQAGSITASWPGRFSATAGDRYDQRGTVQDFELVQAQLDQDAPLELIVAHRVRANDVGMQWWDLAVIDATGLIRFQLANYGEGTLSQHGDGCALLGTTWIRDRPPGASHESWFLTGRRYQLLQGGLRPLSEPVRARRLLDSFVPGYVVSDGVGRGTPGQDLSHDSVLLEQEPEVLFEELGRQTLRLDRVQAAPQGLVFEAGGQRWTPAPGQTAGRADYQLLGDAGSRRLWPPGYLPASDSGLRGRPLVLSSQVRMWWYQQQRVLWLGSVATKPQKTPVSRRN